MVGGCAPPDSPSTWTALGRLSCWSQPSPSAQWTPPRRLRHPPPARPLNAGSTRALEVRAHARPSSTHTPATLCSLHSLCARFPNILSFLLVLRLGS